MRKAWLAALAILIAAAPAWARGFAAASADQILAALKDAGPGDVITIMHGGYALPEIRLTQSGEPGKPITLRAARLGDVLLSSRVTELIKVSGSDWVFENLIITGDCAEDSQCEHAFHIVGGADRVTVEHNIISNFNAHIKGNGEGGHFPNGVLIMDNWLFDTHVRHTDNPIATIDVVGGKGWIVRGNLIADYAKSFAHPAARTDDWSYALFFKGNAADTLIDNNIVLCADQLPPQPYTRGPSLGGSATGPQYCQESCDHDEARGGTIADNLVMACNSEPGIYLFRAAASAVSGNTLIGTGGILAVSPDTTAHVEGNLLAGGTIAAKSKAALSLGANRIAKAAHIPDWAAKTIAAYRAYLPKMKNR
jgi:hypothetical protein